jgi:hypothetical protein
MSKAYFTETVETEIDGKKEYYTLKIYNANNSDLGAIVLYKGKSKDVAQTFPVSSRVAEETLRIHANLIFSELYKQSKKEED